MALTFPKSVRLTLSSEFLRVKTEGRARGGRYLTLGILKEPESVPTRVGLITSRRVGGAVVRNRVRRRLREIVRLSRPRWRSGLRLVIVARHAAARASFAELNEEWLRLAKRGGVFADEDRPHRGSSGDPGNDVQRAGEEG